jgi:hypothetical protein
MTASVNFWLGFASGVIASGSLACFIAAAVLARRSSEAARYVSRRHS